MLDSVSYQYPQLCKTICAYADISFDHHFESAVMKLQNNQCSALNICENLAVSSLKSKTTYENEDVDPSISLAQRALKRLKMVKVTTVIISWIHRSCYPLLIFVEDVSLMLDMNFRIADVVCSQ